MYSTLTEDQKIKIIDRFNSIYYSPAARHSDILHTIACVASDVLCERKTTKTERRAWNSRVGSEAYAATLTVLVHLGKLRVIPSLPALK